MKLSLENLIIDFKSAMALKELINYDNTTGLVIFYVNYSFKKSNN